MTLHQRDLVKKRCLVDVGKFNVLFVWMKINNPVFANFQLPTELHPKIIVVSCCCCAVVALLLLFLRACVRTYVRTYVR